jgi:hypothetical protein
VADRSVFFCPSDIGELPDEEEHFVAFRPGQRRAWFCSELKRIVRLSSEDAFSGRSGHRRTERLGPLYEQLATELIELFEKSAKQRGTYDERIQALIGASRQTPLVQQPAEYAGFLSLTLSDCELLVLNP